MGTVTTSTPRPGVRRLTLDRPDALNSMTAELIEELHTGLRAIREDSDVRAVVLTGAGRAFCAGIDLRGYGEPPQTPAGGRAGRRPGCGCSNTSPASVRSSAGSARRSSRR